MSRGETGDSTSTAAVILAGGAGERFWPLSRRDRPKQLLPLVPGGSLLRQTYERAAGFAARDLIWVVTSETLAGDVERELPEVPRSRILGEPLGRNTAPAVALGCRLVAARDPETVTVVLPSDHLIPDRDAFLDAVDRASRVARETGGLVTFGVEPTRPETGYGYIERGAPLGTLPGAFRAARFHEKPGAADARAYAASGRHFWNSGIFVWTARALLDELAAHQPAISRALPAAADLADAGRRREALLKYFQAVPSLSVDRGLMEVSGRVHVVEARFPWSDLGGWEAWGEAHSSDRAGNSFEGDVVSLDARDNIVYSDAGGRVAVLGVDGLVIVRTRDAVLVAPRHRVQDVRDLVRKMREENVEDPLL